MLNIIEIENKSNELLKTLFQTVSPKYNLLQISQFFTQLLEYENKAIAEAYIIPLLNAYVANLKKFDPFGFKPHNTSLILELLNKLIDLNLFDHYKAAMEEESRRISYQLNELKRILKGSSSIISVSRPSFPTLEIRENHIRIGSLENISVKISSNNNENSFLIVPSGRDIEEKISAQVKNSWKAACSVAENYVKKISAFHEVIIHLEKRSADYIGNSMGVVLTIVMIEELLKYYNAASEIIIKNNVAITGGVKDNGEIIPVSSQVIVNKIDTVFYSPIQNFVLHENDKQAAYERLHELQSIYPLRDLKISAVENFRDVLNRRDIVDIKKRSPITRSLNTLKNNVAAVLLTVMLGFVIVYSGMVDFDENPSILDNDGNMLYVKNKSGKVLWTKKMGFDNNIIYERTGLYLTQKVYDINDDGMNEVILCNEHVDEFKNGEGNFGRISVFNPDGTLMWEYIFKDSASTKKDLFSNIYSSFIIDVVRVGGRKLLYAFAKHEILYPAAVYSLDVITGKRVNDVLWHPGHLSGGLINDFDGDGSFELYAIAINNGLERSAVFSIDINKLNGCAPSTPSYLFNGKKIAEFENYILLPKTDVNKILGNRYNVPLFGNFFLSMDNRRINFPMVEAWSNTSPNGIFYQYFYRENKFEAIVDDNFQVLRDSLISGQSDIETSSKEYKEMLLEQVRYWNGEKFVADDPNKN